MIQIAADLARSNVATTISNTATSVTLTTGGGSLFPNPSAGTEYFPLIHVDPGTSLPDEIAYCTSRSGDVLTIARAQEGTTGVTWTAGDVVFCGPTKGTLDALAQKEQVQQCAFNIAADSGTVNNYLISLTPTPSLVNGMWIGFTTSNTNTTTTPNLTVNGNTYPITLPGGGAVQPGSILGGTITYVSYNSAGRYELISFNKAAFANVLTNISYPTVETSDNKITVTPATNGSGGTVSIGAGTVISLAEALSTGVAVSRLFTTASFTSPSLSTSSTYYLRAQVIGGVLTPYVQKGSDSDSIPGSLVGTVNGTSGGGFHSTKLDILIAKITTGLSGTTPTVIELANADSSLKAPVYYAGSTVGPVTSTFTINWGRAPIEFSIQDLLAPGGGTDSDQQIRVDAFDRYSVSVYSSTWQGVSGIGACGYKMNIKG